MTKRRRTSTIIIVIFATIFLFVIVCAILANTQNDKNTPTPQLSRWMDMIEDSTLLKTLAIPGAHDAGTRRVAYVAETQDREISDLLACGTRYLDLRVAAGEELKIYHGPFKGVTLESVLNAVKKFLTTNKTETVILDFQHFDGEAQNDTATKVGEILKGLFVANTSDKSDVQFVDTLTLGAARGKCIVVWGDGYEDVLTAANAANVSIFKRNNDEGTRENSVMHSYYESSLNKKSSAKYIETALPHYIDLYKQQGSGLFVLQGQLTDGLLVFGPRFREVWHNKRMNIYIENLQNSADLNLINIIIRDFVCPSKNCYTLQLNLWKGNVKADRTAAFEQMIAESK